MTETQKPVIESFEEQFNKPIQVETFDGVAEYVDITPEITKHDVPILMAGGWSLGRKAFMQAGEELYERGARVLLVNHARHGKAPEDDYGKWSPVEVHKANTLLQVIESCGAEKVDVIAHSEGALNTVLAAQMAPDRIRNIVLVAPAGMTGEDSLADLTKRLIPKMIRTFTQDRRENPDVFSKATNQALVYFKENVPKSLKELAAISHTSIDSELEELRDHDIRIGLIQSRFDRLFHLEKIGEHVRLEDIADEDGKRKNIDAYSTVSKSDSGHDDLIFHPQYTTHAAWQMLVNFEDPEYYAD